MAVFKGKEVRVQLVPKDTPSELSDETLDFTTAEVIIDKLDNVAKDILREGASLLLIYIAADTVRKVVIELAKK